LGKKSIEQLHPALKLLLPYSWKFSHGANFHVFRGMLVNHENKNCVNFYERTLELEDVPPSLFQDLCGSPPCASFTARQTFYTPCVSTRDHGGDHLHGFLPSEAMVKGYQAYRAIWATVLSEEMPCLREVGNLANYSLT